MARVLIAGAGPGGAALAYLLARRGIDVTLLERQTDFAREFRGEAMLPGGLAMIDQMGLWEQFEGVPHVDIRAVELFVDARREARLEVDLGQIGPHPPRWVSQPDFLEMLVAGAGAHASFRLERGVTVRDLVREGGRVVGLRCAFGDGERDLRADLVIGADGRSSVVRRRAAFRHREDPIPMDIVWFKLPAPHFVRDDVHARAYVGGGHLLLMAPVPGDRVQIAWIIPKGGFRQVRERGMAACLEEMMRLVSADLADHLRATGAAAMDPFLLSTVSDRVAEWTRPGLLLIGDAAHTMSPVGGQGINIALRDAVVAANHLVPALLGSADPAKIDAAIRRVEEERVPEIERIQRLQAVPPRLLFRPGRVAGWILRVGAFFLRAGFAPPVAGGVARSFFFGVTDVQLKA